MVAAAVEEEYRKNSIKSPFSVQLELTESCNHRCNYCYNFWNYGSHHRSVPPLQEYDFRRMIDKLIEAEVFQVILTGGEPFLRKELVFGLVDYCRSNGLNVDINTNLTAISETDLDRLSDTNVGFLVSFPSFREETYTKIVGSGSYRKLIQNLEHLAQLKNPLSVNMVVTQLNLPEVYDTGEFLVKQFGVSSFSATPLSGTKGAEDHQKLSLNRSETLHVLDELVRLNRDYNLFVDSLQPLPLCMFPEGKINEYALFLKRSCAAGKTTLTISPLGEVRPCSHASQTYGNILEQSVSDIWQKMEEWRTKKFVPEECKECSVLDYCLAGCRTNAEHSNLDLDAQDPLMAGKIVDGKFLLDAKDRGGRVVTKGEKYSVQKGFKYRKESGGIFTIYNKGDVQIINEQILKVLLAEEVIDTTGLDNNGLEIVSMLLRSNLLKQG